MQIENQSPNPTPRRRGLARTPYTPLSPHIVRDESRSGASSQMLIYGTTIDQSKLYDKLKTFVRTFENRLDGTRVYSEAIRRYTMEEVADQGALSVRVNAAHLFEYDPEIYSQLVHYPVEVIITLDQVFSHVLLELQGISYSSQDPATAQQRDRAERVVTEIFGLIDQSSMRMLNPETQLNSLVSIKGFVTKCSDLIPELKKAAFRCNKCRHETFVDLINTRIEEPAVCPHCNKTHTFEIMHSECHFNDKQVVKLQELPEYVPEGETPHAVTLILTMENVDRLRPGDKVEVVGIYRACSRRVVRNMRLVHSVYQTHLDTISFQLLNKNHYKNEEEEINFSEQEVREFHSLANDPDLYNKLTASLAPNIWELQSVKKGILCQIFGGSKSSLSDSQSRHFRPGIHVLLVGDPSTAKSQVLKYVANVAPRVIYSTGRGSSAMGLTAAITKDPDTNEFVLESGALILADKGICCLDQFDKMNDSSKTVLLESMEQQTISVAKAGIVCQLNARTSILAAANPIHSMYDPKKSIIENINLPSNLLSRFDLIYLMIDKPDRNRDLRLASHLLGLYGKDHGFEAAAVIPRSFLTNYISYAKRMVNPIITPPVAKRLAQAYVDMRKLGSSSKCVTATPRQLDSMIRISEALARMRLSAVVHQQDVDDAYHMINQALMTAAIDPQSGIINMDQILLGMGARSKERDRKIEEVLRKMLVVNRQGFEKGINFRNLLEQVKTKLSDDSYNEGELRRVLERLQSEDVLSKVGSHTNPIIRVNNIR